MKNALREDWNRVVGAVDRNGGIEATAKIIGVSKKTLIEWMKKGTMPVAVAINVYEKLKIHWVLLAYGKEAGNVNWKDCDELEASLKNK